MEYNMNTASIELSVRELCARALGGGDLEYGGGRALAERGRIGADMHRRIQSERSGRYRAEVPLCNTTRYGELTYTVSGRADGIEQDEEGYTVEEIKTMHSRVFSFPVPEIYLAQLRCYAYFFCVEKGLGGVNVRMICINIDNDKQKESTVYASVEQLREYYFSLLARIERWAMLIEKHQREELPALAALKFPYTEMRQGQEDMIRAVYRAAKRGERLFVQAPTGIGKTMSSLYPAVRACGEGLADRIFYLTAKASTRREAFGAVRRLVQNGAPLRAAVLTAREQICPHPSAMADGRSLSSHCNGVECEYAMGYYDRVGDAVYELLTAGRGYDRRRLLEVAQKHKVCPYELSLDVSEYCDVIIADYNYAFDPMVYLRRYFSAGASCEGRNVFLIDEAHNLADRARDMYSVSLSRRAFEKVYAKVDRRDKVLNEALETVILAMRSMRRLCRDNLTTDDEGNECGFYLSHSPLTDLHEKLLWFSDQCDTWMRRHGEEDIAQAVRDLCYTVHEYTTIMEHYDEHYVTYVTLSGGDTYVQLLCLDPSGELNVLLHRANAAVLFSATLTPLSYFCDVLGGGEDARKIALASPYDRDNFGLFVVEGVSTRYSQRRESCRHIAACIGAAISGKKGNYIVYFPSYSYLENVLVHFHALYPKVTTIVQKKAMRAAEREAFLDAFVADSDVLRVGFCVLGGSFSEGVDLPGSRLIGSIIVGVGLPGLSGERNILQEYYQNKSDMGYQYAYVYPGMNRVLQAAGRVIRTDEDKGIVVLIDDRYESPEYRRLFPSHWSHAKYAGNAKNLAEMVAHFWNKN